MSKVRVVVSRNYRGIPYLVEARLDDFDAIGKVIQAVESFIEENVGKG
jgi:hypothetical protein